MPDGELWFVIGLRVHGKRVFVSDEKALEFARAALDQIGVGECRMWRV